MNFIDKIKSIKRKTLFLNIGVPKIIAQTILYYGYLIRLNFN